MLRWWRMWRETTAELLKEIRFKFPKANVLGMGGRTGTPNVVEVCEVLVMWSVGET